MSAIARLVNLVKGLTQSTDAGEEAAAQAALEAEWNRPLPAASRKAPPPVPAAADPVPSPEPELDEWGERKRSL
jgi:hypothetical protein